VHTKRTTSFSAIGVEYVNHTYMGEHYCGHNIRPVEDGVAVRMGYPRKGKYAGFRLAMPMRKSA
jgi:hypothetical protein